MIERAARLLPNPVITLDEDVRILGSRQVAEDCRVRVSFEPLAKEAAKDERRGQSRRLLAEINDALAGAPDLEEKKLRNRMMRRLRQRDHEW